jgi:hypothetical protein
MQQNRLPSSSTADNNGAVQRGAGPRGSGEAAGAWAEPDNNIDEDPATLIEIEIQTTTELQRISSLALSDHRLQYDSVEMYPAAAE